MIQATYRGEVLLEHAGDKLERRSLDHLQQICAQRVTILLQEPCIAPLTSNNGPPCYH